MPTFKTGNMWDVFDEVDYFIITTNSFIRKDGALVMGRGIASQAKAKWPELPYKAGVAITHMSKYGLLLGHKIGLFQVKYHFKDQADPELIKYSADELTKTAKEHSDLTFALNYPGIGNGGLPVNVVAPLLEPLPDNVQIWTFK